MTEHPKFRRAEDGTLLLNFGEYGKEVEVAAISGDGRRVLTVREVGTAEVWELASGARVGLLRPASPLQGAKGEAPVASEFKVFIEAAALSADGTLALLGLNDGTAGVFQVSDGARLAVLHPPGEQPASGWGVIRAVAYSPDGALALVGFRGRCVGVWSTDGQRAVAFLRPPEPARLVGRPFVRDTLVSSVAASPDNRFVFAGCVDMTASIWDLAGGESVFEALEHAADTLGVFDDGDRFGWATTAGDVWCARSGAELRKVLATGEHWSEVALRGGEFLTRGSDGSVRHWTHDGTCTPLFSPGTPVSARWSDSARTLDFDGERLHYPESGNRLAIHSGGARMVVQRKPHLVKARFVPGGGAVALSGWSDEVELWSMEDGRCLRTFPSPGSVGDFALSADGRLIAMGEAGHGGGLYPRHVYLYEVATAKLLHRLEEHAWQVAALDFSPDGDRLASIGDEVVVWRLDTSPPRVELRVEVKRAGSAIRFLPDGRLLVLDDGRARVFRGPVEEQALEVPFEYRTPWCLSPDGDTLSLGLRNGVVRIELSTGKRQTWLAPIPRYEQLPSSELAQRAGIRNVCALWRTAWGRFTHQSDGPRGWVQPAHLSADGRVALPTRTGAVVLDVTEAPRVVASVPFEGKLRAGRVVGDSVVLVNEQGKVFQAELPGHPRA
ncbi:WD40 repeat domain-containing protein [Pyxidicoccus xibeiensis]|uniref:WD40 repeat domain-containing protein n=1 Tax=Pyxidicoccus xibeiensis TaxID=2906759 RepID=UPI0020A790BA|nr:WD40 repeat domain-containing protein [Pyxidicoccus xibeiensis]MCP3138599.1 WD40 repeat domain-containing protein [Pyxidicoccus xibeiensis]